MMAEWSLAVKQARFARLCEEAIMERHTMGDAGIGTLAEKRLHSLIKRFLCEDTDCHEVGVAATRFVSDIRIGNDIYEVQTGAFYPMRRKIEYYLNSTECTVTVVHPIPVVRWNSWIDPQTKEITKPKKSPKRGRAIDLLPELYALLPMLGNPRLRFRLLMLEVQDFRILNGWSHDRKRGSERYERIPVSLLDDLFFSAPEDFRSLFPNGLVSPFPVKEYSRLTGIRGRDAYSAVRSLAALGVLVPAPPIGRSMAWSATTPAEAEDAVTDGQKRKPWEDV